MVRDHFRRHAMWRIGFWVIIWFALFGSPSPQKLLMDETPINNHRPILIMFDENGVAKLSPRPIR